MPIYVFYAAKENVRRSDGCNTLVAPGADPSAAQAVAEQLLGENAGALNGFAAVEMTEATAAFAVQGHPPVGGLPWPSLGRGGSRLRGS
jgi:hypothetical protein